MSEQSALLRKVIRERLSPHEDIPEELEFLISELASDQAKAESWDLLQECQHDPPCCNCQACALATARAESSVGMGEALNVLDRIREKGWLVAVHNDYMQAGEFMTFWLFTKNGRCVKGEAGCDHRALIECEEKALRIDAERDGAK